MKTELVEELVIIFSDLRKKYLFLNNEEFIELLMDSVDEFDLRNLEMDIDISLN